MFDGVPEFYARRRRGKRLSLGAAAFLLLTGAVALLGFEGSAPFGPETVVSSASHLRQVEVFAGPAGTKLFFLHNAGYRLPHELQLIGIVYGAQGFAVTWLGPDAVRIFLRPGWSRLVAGHPKGVAATFAPATSLKP
jgi:hypothetical protein